MECPTCENRCSIPNGGSGVCGMYANHEGVISERFPDQYLVMVPSAIESMPMLHYHPGSKFLQVCTIGCNFRCSGCVSWILTESLVAIESAVRRTSPEDIVAKAMEENCRGVMFCFNEPAVSFPTFKRVATLARSQGLLVGCATNGYFTETAFQELLQHIDFINLGIKGCTDETYAQFGATSASPMFRNLKASFEYGVATEVAAVYVRGHEDELLETARRVAAVSRDIPFQVMRFIPLGTAEASGEPSIREAEHLCQQLGKLLKFVYLFNAPGTSFLDTYCPECGESVIQRGFNGPMCAHVSGYRDGGTCGCGHTLPVIGAFEKESGAQVLGFFGGYKTISSLESIQTVLAFLGERRPEVVASVLHQILETDFIKDLYARTKTIDSYLDTVDHYAQLAGRTREAQELRIYIEDKVAFIREQAKGADRPYVYFSLGHPLVAVFGDKFECNLVEIAGGCCANKDLLRDETPGVALQDETLRQLDPDIILSSGGMGFPVEDVQAYCSHHHLDLKASRGGRIHNLHPFPASGRPDWILGLMQMANLIHPELFHFDMDRIGEDFYSRFLKVPFRAVRKSRSIPPAPTRLGSDGV
ncbi:radical SAM protein [Holophaga foetida]|uniref:radical SAM protein n=1 Tax=Holophaga foetida TaxID=35839 RepID=UPI0002473EF3|nr:radical SAM protein [Holophaga foetida]